MQVANETEEIHKCLFFGVKRKRLSKPSDSVSALNKAVASIRPNEAGTSNQIVTAFSANEEIDHQKDADESDKEEDGMQVLKDSKLKVKLGKRKKNFGKKNTGTKVDEVKALRKQNRIFVWGDDIPGPIKEFLDIKGMPEQLLKNLGEFGVIKPTPIQMQAIPVMLKDFEFLGAAPTGSGKTLAFAIPIILKIVRLKRLPKYQGKNHLIAIILEPTKELAKQVYVQFLKFSQGLPIACSLLECNEIVTEADVLVSTPNRLTFALPENPSTLLNKLRWLIVDEGDRLFDTTEGEQRCFRNQLAKIYQACNISKFIHHAFYSATFSYEVEEWCKENLPSLAVVCVGPRNSAIDFVRQELIFTGNEQGKIVALRALFCQGFEPPAIIFLQSKDRARQLFSEIEGFHLHVPTAIISSDVNGREREAAIAQFREGNLWVLICTELAGRGLDFRGVNLVINFDLPTSVISYIHRIGRAGRAGRQGKAITYFTEADQEIIRPIATVISQAGFPVPAYTLKMQKLSRKTKKKLLKHAPKRRSIGVPKKLLLKKSKAELKKEKNDHKSQLVSQSSE